MKRTQITDSIRNIRKRIVSYLSICLVIMLGIGVFLAMRYMDAGIAAKASAYLNGQSFKDFEFMSTLGASDDTVEQIRSISGVTDAEGVMQYDASLRSGRVKAPAIVLSVTEHVSVPLLTDGRMPAEADECVIGEDFSEDSGIAIGDRISLSIIAQNGSDDPLTDHEFKVCGLIKHPDYIHRKLRNIVVLPLSAFNGGGEDIVYSRVFIKTDDVSADDFYRDSYFDITADVRRNLKEAEDSLAEDRAAEIRSEAYSRIDREWEDALAKLEDGEDEIAANESKLDSELAKGRKKLNSAGKTLAAKLKKYNKKLNDGEKSLARAEKELDSACKEFERDKAAYEEIRDLFVSKTSWVSEALDDVNKLRNDPGSESWYVTEQHLATLITNHKQDLQDLIDFSQTPEAQELVPLIEEATGNDDIALYLRILGLTNAEEILEPVEKVKKGEYHFVKDDLDIMEKVFGEVLDVNEKLDEAGDDIAKAEKKLADAKKTLKERKAELKKGRADIRKEQAAAEKKIAAGWAKYRSEKARYEADLEEAKALLSENREEAERKLEEAKAEVNDIECTAIVLDRNSNPGYIDVRSSLDSVRSVGLVFGVLFIMIAALVCLSTLVIIIEEQKSLIGTTKAFGFHKREVLGKYLSFAASAALLGDILALIMGIGLCTVVLRVYSSSNLYQYGIPTTVFKPVPTVLISVLLVLVCSVSSVMACSDIMKSPASALMKGETLRSRRKKRKTTRIGSGSGSGSLYSRLILRNMLDDKARVIVSTSIVAFCCMLIGIGFSFQLAFNGMYDKQKSEVNLYDFRMDLGSSVRDEDRLALEAVLDENGADYAEAVYESRLFDSVKGVTGLFMIAGEPSEIDRFIGIRDSEGRIPVPEDGVLVSERMCEVFDLAAGGDLTLYDSDIEEHKVKISGTYTNYYGRVIVCPAGQYRQISGGEFEPNACYVKLGKADSEAVRAALTAVTDDISFESGSSYKTTIESVRSLYSIIVFVTTGIAILMSFMILTNLSNIYVIRKKRELTVMRVNGFSIGQTKGYLAQESLVTTLIGLTLGVLAGVLLAPFATGTVEPADLQFDKSLHILAWIAAAGLEGLFALIIYSFTFRQIKHFNLRDIT